MPMKCVLQIPEPIANPAARSQIRPVPPVRVRTRCSSLSATEQVIQHTLAARTTTQAVCSSVRQVKARHIEGTQPAVLSGRLRIE